MKGLKEELRRREEKHLRTERAVLSETQQQEINATLVSLKKGDRVAVTHYVSGYYVTEDLTFRKNDPVEHNLVFEEKDVYLNDVSNLIVY